MNKSQKQEFSIINNTKILPKPSTTKNRYESTNNTINFNSFLINSIPEEINQNDSLKRFNCENQITKKKDSEINSNRNSIHIEKNVSNFINKKNEDLFRETMKSSFNPFPINSLSISLEE